MPYLHIQTNVAITTEKHSELLKAASQTLANALGKSENYVMVALQTNVPMLFAGSNEPLAFVQLQSLGLSETQTKTLSQVLCDFIEQHLVIPKARVYIEFASPPRSLWGWNGSTFG